MIGTLLLGMGLGAAGTGFLFYAREVEPRTLEINRKTLYLPALPPALDGMTILHISDFHFHDKDRRPALFFQKVVNLKADLVLITGDFVEHDQHGDYCFSLLSKLSAPHGMFAVLGNHDHYCVEKVKAIPRLLLGMKVPFKLNDVTRLVQNLGECGIRTLMNEHTTIEVGGETIYLVGTDDHLSFQEDYHQAFQGVPSDAFTIYMGHSPDNIHYLPEAYSPDLMLSGHTHGGQVRSPLGHEILTNSLLKRGYGSGAFAHREIVLHTSRGLGSGKPFRLRYNCPPEATVLELKRGPMNVPKLQIGEKSFYWSLVKRILEEEMRNARK